MGKRLRITVVLQPREDTSQQQYQIILPGRVMAGRKAYDGGGRRSAAVILDGRSRVSLPYIQQPLLTRPTTLASSPRADGCRGEKGVGVVVRRGKDMRTPDVVIVVVVVVIFLHGPRYTVTMATTAERSNARGNSHSNDITLLYCNTWR